MQTKKRAKPVKFGNKTKDEKLTEKTSVSSDESKELLEEESSAVEESLEDRDPKEEAEADINSPETKEIKRIVEEKVNHNDEEETAAGDDEPQEVKLSEDLPEEKEEKALEDSVESSVHDPKEEVEEKTEKEVEEPEKPALYGSFTNDEKERKPRRKNSYGFFFLIAFITFTVGLAFITGLSYLMSGSEKGSFSLSVLQGASPTPTAEPTASPTPEEVDLSAYEIRVLNGSGTSGEAAAVRGLLTGKGFTVASVGNAATSDYTTTVISAQEEVEESYLNALIKALQDDYKVNSVVEDAPSSQTADVVVTVGSEPAE